METGGASRREKFARNCGKADGCNLSEGREKEKNSLQMLNYMWQMKYRDIIVPDSFYVGLQGLEQWALTNK